MLVLVDQDGVLADFDAAFTAALRAAYPAAPVAEAATRGRWKVRDCYPAEWSPVVEEIPRQPGFFASLPVVDGAVAALEGMRAAGHEVFICTAPLSDSAHCPGEKHAWVEEHLGSYWTRRIVLTKDKTLVRGDVLIDDKPTVTGLLTPSWTHVVFGRPYNADRPGPRLDGWAGWAGVLARLAAHRTAA